MQTLPFPVPMKSLFCASLFVAGLVFLPASLFAADGGQHPNIIFILTDDLGYGDVGVFFQNARKAANDRSQPWHLTPKIDAMAADGMQLTDHYCPAPVCAPSRASLILGVTQGHANVRDNQFDKALEANHTIASVLKSAGYATACIGKWGLQGKKSPDAPNGWPAHPMNRGFDEYFGYISHNAGHFHYPKEDKQMLLEGSTDVVADYDGCYTTDLFTARAKKWIADRTTQHPKQPFFLYLAYDTPHAKLQYPPCAYPAGGGKTGGIQWLGKPGKMINTADGKPDSYCYPQYANETWDNDHDPATPEVPWPDVYKRFASDVHRIDDCVGDLLQLLKDLHIDENTLVVFTSDNGPSRESYLPQQYEPTFFHSFGPFDGIKRDCWEGGIRVGAIARWPGRIAPHRVSHEPSAFWDWMPTFTELAGLPAPARSDGVSLVPTLTGKGKQATSLTYFEYFEANKTPAYKDVFAPAHQGRVRKQMQAIRLGDYIGVRYNVASHADPFEIYNIVSDPQELTDLGNKPDFASLQQKMKDTVLQARRPDPEAKRPYDAELVPSVNPAKTESGVSWQIWKGAFPWVPKIEATPVASGVQAQVDSKCLSAKEDAACLFSGYIEAPADGSYTFHLAADTGALLRVHEATVIDADASYHGGTESSGTILLKAGKHPFRLYVRHVLANASQLTLKWSGPNLPESEIPANALSHGTAELP